MKAAVAALPGPPDRIKIIKVPVPILQDRQVLVKVHCTAINRADVLQRQGKYPPPPGESDILGLEAAGTVEKVGSGCASKWRVGDRVMALLSAGGNAEFVAVDENHLLPIDERMTFREAAAVPQVWLMAFQLLHSVAHVKEGESVLIHAGGSGVGTAAIQLVRLAKARAYVTAGSQLKIDFAKGLGAVEGFNYKQGSFSKQLLNATNGKGVDIVLDAIGGNMWEDNADSLALGGRWVMYGTLGGTDVNGNIIGKIILKRLTVTGSTLRSRSREYKSELVAAFREKALPHFRSGLLRTVISSVLPFNDLAEAHKVMESNTNIGKIVIEVIPCGKKSEP